MAQKFKSFREESKTNWGVTQDEKDPLNNDQLRTGAMLRIADATEKMARNHIDLINDRDRFERYYREARAQNRSMFKSMAGLKGQITRLKKKLAAKG
jgi:hypothetical protein